MSTGLERGRERHGFPHQEEVTGRSIVAAVHQIDELKSAIAAVRALHQPFLGYDDSDVCRGCLQYYPCPTIRALPDVEPVGGGAA